jgi:hypothetical protein
MKDFESIGVAPSAQCNSPFSAKKLSSKPWESSPIKAPMYQINFTTEDLERFIESFTRYSSYLVDHALKMEAQHTPQGDAASRQLRNMSAQANVDLENLQLLRRRGPAKTP